MSTVKDNRFYREASKQQPLTGNAGCPFCGESEALSLYSCGYHHVHCSICFTDGPTGKTPEIAIEGWNTRVRDHLGVRLLMTRGQADRLLSHLCELEQHFDLEPDGSAELDLVRRALADSIVGYDRANRDLGSTRDSDGSGEAGETRSGSTEGDSACRQASPKPQVRTQDTEGTGA